MADLVLRNYQEKLVAGIRDAWTRSRSVLAWMPTGAGKTEISVYLAQAEAAKGGCTLFVVDRKTLAGQARMRYSAKYGLLTGLLRGEDTFVRGYEPALIATVQTLQARWEQPEVMTALSRITLVVIDEAHIRFGHHEQIIRHLPNARVLGLTATPLRDGLGLMFGAMVRGPSYTDLLSMGYLVRPRYFIPHVQDIADGLKSVGVAATGDYVVSQLSELMRRKTIVGDVVETWRDKANNRPTIVFCADIAHSRATCDGFLQAGIAAEHIDLHTDEIEREEMFKRFRNGETRVLCSIVVLAVGFDEPVASCAILARPTLSLTMHIQQVGRVLRACEGKPDALILDHAGNVLRHGRVEEFSPPELSSIDKRTDKKAKIHVSDLFPCPACRAVMSPGQRVCGECGHEIARRNRVDFVPGRLVENATGERDGMAESELRDLYLELRHIHRSHGKSPDHAARIAYAQILEHFAFKCPYSWRYQAEKLPTARTVNLDLSWRIAWRKRQEKIRAQPVAACPSCGGVGKREGPGTGPHAARLECAHCGQFLKWLSRDDAAAGRPAA